MLDSSYFDIFSRLGDNLSREIFLERLKFSFAGGFSIGHEAVDWVDLMRKSVPDVFKNWDVFLERAISGEFSKETFYIFGASNCGKTVYSELKRCAAFEKLKISGFVDNFKKGEFLGLPIVSPVDLNPNETIVIVANSVRKHVEEILRQLAHMGFAKVYSFIDHALLAGREYFDLLKPSAEEIFIDAGCFDGETTLAFLAWCKGNYRQIYAFEAEAGNYSACNSVLRNIKNIELFNQGLYDYDGEAIINIGDRQSSCNALGDHRNTANAWVKYEDKQTIKVGKLDTLLKDVPATFIKMDIEGSEIPAIIGAERVIRTYKPKLAISVYHRPSDILEIPRMVLACNPNYRLYLRHYSPFNAETDLYAVDGGIVDA